MSTTTSVPKALKINNKLISFPYINKNINAEPTNRLMVDIIEINENNQQPSNFVTTSLKYVFCEYYPQYSQYLKKHHSTSLQDEIRNYYETVILTEIEYKYKVGQFGYIYNGHSLEKSFVIITEKCDKNREIFFLHGQLKKYKYQHYDITSPTPKILTDNELSTSSCSETEHDSKDNDTLVLFEWTTESLFTSIDGTIEPTNDATNDLIELLNWKICREDYLLKKVNRIKMTLGLKGEHTFVSVPLSQTDINSLTKKNINITSTNEDTPTDDEQTSYLPESDEKSSYYTSTDNDNGANKSATESTVPPTGIGSTSTETSGDDEKLLLLTDFGYYKEKFECYTLKGELFVALNRNNKGKDEEVTIKKMTPYEPSYVPSIVIDARLVKNALISRHLKTQNTLIRNSIVKYVDFFQSKTNYFSVIERDFSINLKEFVVKSLQYIKEGKLSFSEYHETMKYLLWRLSATIHWLHGDIKCSDLDVCPENIMLSRAEFIQNSDGSVTINLQIEVKFIDFGVRELLQLCNYDISAANKNKFKTNYNKHYLELKNGQYIAPVTEEEEEEDYHYDPYAADMWRFGMVIYYCYFGNYPYNEIPSDNTETDNDIGYWSVHNGKLNEYIKTKSPFKCIDPKVISLINGLLSIDENKRLKSINVLQHKWFNSFYKAYLSIMK